MKPKQPPSTIPPRYRKDEAPPALHVRGLPVSRRGLVFVQAVVEGKRKGVRRSA